MAAEFWPKQEAVTNDGPGRACGLAIKKRNANH